MKNKEIFERNKETLKFMLSDKGFGLNDKWHLVPIDKATKEWKPMK